MIELNYDIEPDKNRVIDGRILAAKLIDDAYSLLIPYAAGCPQCTDELFTAISNIVLEQRVVEQDEEAFLESGRYFCAADTKEEQDTLFEKHRIDTVQMTSDFIKETRARYGSIENHPHDTSGPKTLSL